MGGVGSGARPKVYAPELVSQIRDLYRAGHTQEETADIAGVTRKIVYNVMRRHGIHARVAAKRDQAGPNNHMWRGSNASYQALHLRVEAARGKPCHCQRCGTTDPTRRYDWANLTGDYANISDYQRMCRHCHRKYDQARRQRTGARTSPVRR